MIAKVTRLTVATAGITAGALTASLRMLDSVSLRLEVHRPATTRTERLKESETDCKLDESAVCCPLPVES